MSLKLKKLNVLKKDLSFKIALVMGKRRSLSISIGQCRQFKSRNCTSIITSLYKWLKTRKLDS